MRFSHLSGDPEREGTCILFHTPMLSRLEAAISVVYLQHSVHEIYVTSYLLGLFSLFALYLWKHYLRSFLEIKLVDNTIVTLLISTIHGGLKNKLPQYALGWIRDGSSKIPNSFKRAQTLSKVAQSRLLSSR